MTKLLPLLITLLCVSEAFTQVGINTTNPTSTLDINGSIRVRTLSVEEGEAIKLIGVDQEGNMMEVDVSDNIVLEDNRLRVVDTYERISEPFEINIAIGHNVNFIILPGEPNDEKTMIRVTSSLGAIQITGIEAAPNGKRLTIYAADSTISFRKNSPLSAAGNRIIGSTNGWVVVERYNTIDLMYDAVAGGWIVMSRL